VPKRRYVRCSDRRSSRLRRIDSHISTSLLKRCEIGLPNLVPSSESSRGVRHDHLDYSAHDATTSLEK